MIWLIGMLFALFAAYVGFLVPFWAVAFAALVVGVAGGVVVGALHWFLSALCEMAAGSCRVIGHWVMRPALQALWRAPLMQTAMSAGWRARRAARRALATAPVFTRVCAGVLAVLVLCVVAMNWLWVPVVAVVVWHVWPTRRSTAREAV